MPIWEQAAAGAAGGLAGGLAGEVLGLLTGPEKYKQQREHFRAGMGDRAANTQAQLEAVMGMGATLPEALGVGPSGGGAGVSGQVMGNGPQIQMGTQQALQLGFQESERAKDRELEYHRIDVAANTARYGTDTVAETADKNRELGRAGQAIQQASLDNQKRMTTAQIKEIDARLLRYPEELRNLKQQWRNLVVQEFEIHERGQATRGAEHRAATQFKEGAWRKSFITYMRTLGMGPDNLLGTGVYLKYKAKGMDIMNLADWQRNDAGKMAAAIEEMRAMGGKSAKEIQGLLYVLQYLGEQTAGNIIGGVREIADAVR